MDKEPQFVVCIETNAYPASFEFGKIYRIASDKRAVRHQMFRVIDESGKDYLYPERFFVAVELPPDAKKALFPLV